jgi:hypothetical protein
MNTYFKTHRLHFALLLGIAAILCLAQISGASLTPSDIGLIAAATVAPFPIDPKLQAISLAYRNQKMIADEVLPRVTVGAQEFKYLSYPKGTFFTPPETRVGRRGRPNVVEVGGTEVTSRTFDEALDAEVPVSDINNAASQGMPNPVNRHVEVITDLLALQREVRAAALVFAAGNYAAANKVALSSNDRWDVDHVDSNPIADIVAGLDACVMRPNTMVLGRAVYSYLVRHKTILKAFNGTSGDTGIVPRSFLATLFELDEILVGDGLVNTAKPGQTPSLARAWGKHCALIYRNKMADTNGGVTFGYTAEWGQRVAGSWEDKDIGLRGGVRARVGESVREVMVANDLGYFIETAVS